MRVTIETPGSFVVKWQQPDADSSEAQRLGFVLAAALYAVGPTRLDEVLGHCIVALCDNRAFLRTGRPSDSAIEELCNAARRIVAAWKESDQGGR